METKELLSSLYEFVEDSIIYHEAVNDDTDIRIIINSLLRHLPDESLKEINYANCWSSQMCVKAGDFLKSRRRKVQENYPVGDLLHWYVQEGSGKRSLAMSQFRRRFDSLCPDEQNEILKTVFAHGSFTDSLWASKRAKNQWRQEYGEYLAKLWSETDMKNIHMSELSEIVLECMSDEFIILNKWRLAKDLGYHKVCIKVGKCPGFEIEWDRMYFPEQLYVKSKLDIEVEHHETELQIYRYLYENADIRRMPGRYDRGITHDDPLLFNIYGMEHIIWAMGKFGMHEALFRLYDFTYIVKNEPLCYSFENMARIIKEKIAQYGLQENILNFEELNEE